MKPTNMIRTTLTLTAAAVVASGALQADTPTPNPTGWEVAPSAGASLTADTLTMKAKEATNPGGGGVEYAFIGYDPDGTGPLVAPPHRLWDANPVGVVSGLNPGQTYAWRILVRDNVTDDNRTEYSEPMSGVAAADTTLPTVSSWANSVYDGPIGEDDVISFTYTVTFSEHIITTLVPADFNVIGASGASGNVMTVTKTSGPTEPAVYVVVVEPSGIGTIQLKIPAGRVIEDPATNSLDTTLDLLDPTVIIINTGTTPETTGQIRYWDPALPSAPTDGVSQGGLGTWDTSTAIWDRGAVFDAPIAWSNGLDLVASFGGEIPNSFSNQVTVLGPLITLGEDISLGRLLIDMPPGPPRTGGTAGQPAPRYGQNHVFGEVGEDNTLTFTATLDPIPPLPGTLGITYAWNNTPEQNAEWVAYMEDYQDSYHITADEVSATFRCGISGSPRIYHRSRMPWDVNEPWHDVFLTFEPTGTAVQTLGPLHLFHHFLFNKGLTLNLGGDTTGNTIEEVTWGTDGYTPDGITIRKQGSGEWTISQNIYATNGSLNVEAGTLIVNGDGHRLPSGLTVETGGKLVAGGDWETSGLLVESGGTIAPGGSIGTFSVDTTLVEFENGATYEWEVGPGLTSNVINIADASAILTIGDGVTKVELKVIDGGDPLVATDKLDVFTYAAGATTPNTATLLANVNIDISGTSYTGTPVLVNDAGTRTIYLTGLVGGGSSPYGSWQSVNGTAQTLDLDHDLDGVANGVEYFIGGPNGNTTGFTPTPGVTDTAGTLSVTWTHAADYTGVYGTDFEVETSATLEAGSWTTETLGVNVIITGDDVKYTFPAGSKNFARLVVTGP